MQVVTKSFNAAAEDEDDIVSDVNDSEVGGKVDSVLDESFDDVHKTLVKVLCSAIMSGVNVGIFGANEVFEKLLIAVDGVDVITKNLLDPVKELS